ncbi:FAD-linked oxidase C-terminal domain-containing protein [Rossellomorea sp. AcN35-11]|nr:FAD-binding protein [Rossellomorea aquimaris]WJV30855.1 FAD-linked oxidase C-terminal domain-containing protein [Rossellomorea sp. AcN35-11]
MTKNWIERLETSIGKEKVSISESDRFRHSQDESSHLPIEPDVVVFPEGKEDIVEILHVANEYEIPVTPYGAGSGLDGQAIPVQKGISMSFERMKEIISFSPENLTVTVQPGITRLELNKEINRSGLSFPIDPGADASIGGMVATNASGTTAVRYGSMKDQVVSLEVILADGRIIRTGSEVKKSSSGYHLSSLFVGSEGTLGIISEITLKLHGIPEHTIAARCTFDTPKECAEAAHSILMSGIPVMRMELVDASSIKQVNVYGDYHFPEAHSLFLEFAGSRASAEEEATIVQGLIQDMGGENWERASGSKDRAELWRARHELAYAFRHKKGMSVIGSDVCVPLSKLSDLVVYARTLIDESNLLGGVFGHVGDGNFHTILVYPSDDQDLANKAESINDKLVLKALDVGGTCTGEHGVGLGKMKYQELEHGAALEVMRSFKRLLDPEGRLNPGKIWD